MDLTKLLSIIKEEITLVEDYPLTWDIEHFKTLTSYNNRIKYCEEHLTRLGSGSARIVYKIDEEKVLKLAKNKKGLAQNEVEITYSKYNDINYLFSNIFNYEENSLWVEMEYCKKITSQKFKSLVGIDFKTYCEMLKYSYYSNNPIRGLFNRKPEVDPDYWDNEFYGDIFSYMIGYDIPLGDFQRLSSYGENTNNNIVMVDYGLTSEVFSTHYERKSIYK